jgi:hypothetical protein
MRLVLLLALVGLTAASGCAQGRAPIEPRPTDAGLDAPTPFDFPDAVALDASGLDASLEGTDAFVPGAPDAFVPTPDARLPDAAGECVEGTRTPCATSCRTTGSALCAGGRLGACEPPAERCNGMDDDCAGGIDDGFACALGAVGACTTSCGSTGTRACGASCAWSACEPPGTETCNGRDENCDGAVDEGFRARFAFSTYASLAAILPACDGTTQRSGLDCNAAIHRQCRSDGCATSGFGPVENSGDVANSVCVIGEARNVSFAELSARHAPCDGVGERIGPNCNAAIHRWCAANGFVSGYGPVENDGGNATVTCVRSAEVRLTSYSVLRTHHAPCDGTSERVGPSCNAAISRYCTAAGFTSGYGPVENDGDVAYVTCVRP